MDCYLGMIFGFAANYAPEGFSACRGQTLQVSQNQGLFAVMGNVYGGNGSSTFMLPNLMGRFPLGYGVNPTLGQTYPLGQQVDNNPHLQLSIANLPPHTHAASAAASWAGQPSVSVTGDTTMNYSWYVPAVTTATAPTAVPTDGAYLTTAATQVGPTPHPSNIYTTSGTPDLKMPGGSGTATGTAALTVAAPQVSVSNGVTGSGTAINTQPSYSTMNFLIVTQGLYPVRP